VVALAALAWGTLLAAFLLLGPNLGGWVTDVLRTCFGWNAATRTYRLDAVLLVTLEPPLFVLVVALFYADEMRAFLRRLGGRLVSGTAALGFVAAALALVLGGEIAGGAPSRAERPAVREGRPAPRALLTDHRGQPFELGAPGGPPVALTFIYADCHATCPALVATLRSVATLVGGHARFAAVTLDPERDTPEALASYAERWSLDEGWRLLSGARPAIDGVLRAYGVSARRQPDGEIAHDNVIVLLDNAGRIAYTYRGVPQPPEELARVLMRLAAERG
jgi:protein SCO1/2